MITANEARGLAGPTPQERVDMLEDNIKKAAAAKKRSIALHDSFWVHEGYSQTNDYKEACVILEGLGYKVRFFYEERQFVDMYTVVEW
jgi:hypothetical protein